MPTKKEDDEKYPHNAEAMRRMDEARPTPTQAENDLAKTGVMPKDAESKGEVRADDERIGLLTEEEKKDAAAGKPAASYKTRAVESDSKK